MKLPLVGNFVLGTVLAKADHRSSLRFVNNVAKLIKSLFAVAKLQDIVLLTATIKPRHNLSNILLASSAVKALRLNQAKLQKVENSVLGNVHSWSRKIKWIASANIAGKFLA